MSNTGAIRAGRAFVEIGADTNPLVKGLKRGSKALDSFAVHAAKIGGGLLTAGTAILAPLGAAVFKFADIGDQMDKMAARTGISTAALSEMGFAAEQSGAGLEDFEGGVKGMQKQILNAERGLTTATDTLDDLGLTLDDLKGKSPDKQFETIAQRISEVEDPSRKAALSMSIFGRAGQKLLPMLNGGAEGIRKLRTEAVDLGLSISEDQAKAAADFTDAWNRIKRSLGAVVFSIGGALAPVLTELSALVVSYIKIAVQWVQQNAAVIKIVAATGVTLIALGGIALGLALALKVAAVAAGLLAGAVSFILSPLTLTVAALAAVVYYSGAGAAALGWLKSKWESLGVSAGETFGLIKKAMDAGEYTLAAKVLWAALKVAWYQGTADLSVALEEWKTFFTDIWEGAIDGAARFFINSWSKLKEVWVNIAHFFGDAWTTVLNGMKNAWFDFTAAILKAKIEMEFRGTEGDPAKQAQKEMALSGVDLATRVNKKTNQIKTENEINQRAKDSQAELDRITATRLGANEVLDDEAKKRNDAREARLKEARQAAKDNTDAARQDLKDLTAQVKSLAPDQKKESALVTGAKNPAGLASPATAQRVKGSTSGDLRTAAGLQSIVDVINGTGNDKTLEEMKKQTPLLAALVSAVEKNKIKVMEA